MTLHEDDLINKFLLKRAKRSSSNTIVSIDRAMFVCDARDLDYINESPPMKLCKHTGCSKTESSYSFVMFM